MYMHCNQSESNNTSQIKDIKQSYKVNLCLNHFQKYIYIFSYAIQYIHVLNRALERTA